MTVGAMDLPPEGMLLGGVVLAGDPARGIEITEGLSLLFTTKGITVKGQQPATERHFAWSGLDAASCHGEVQRGAGRTATPLELTSEGKTVQFLLPTETVSPGQAAYLDQALPAWLDRYRGTDAPPAPQASAGGTTPAAPPPAAPTPAAPTPAAPTPAAPTPAAPTPAAPTPAAPTPAAPTPAAAMVTPPSAEEHIDPVTGNLRRGDPVGSPGNQGEVEGDKGPKSDRKDRKIAKAGAKAAGVPSAEQGAPSKKPADRRTLIVLIVLIVIVVIAGVAYFVTKNNNSSTTTATTATTSPTSSLSSPAVDKALATSTNLRLSDLPVGWKQAPGSSASISATNTTGKATETPASTAFATCLGTSAAIIGQVFGTTPQADETVASTSPVFQSPLSSQIEMQSAVNIVKTAADAKADATAFTRPGLIACFQQFQAASASALAPGTTAHVEQVTITPPTGGVAYGFITPFTVPNQGTRVVGDAYIIGGRIEATLQPSPHGPTIPSDAFDAAYNAMVARISASTHK